MALPLHFSVSRLHLWIHTPATQEIGGDWFRLGIEAAQGIPRTSDLVNPSEIPQNANDYVFALSA